MCAAARKVGRVDRDGTVACPDDRRAQRLVRAFEIDEPRAQARGVPQRVVAPFDLRESLRRGRRVDAQRDGIARRDSTANAVARAFQQLGREEQRRMALIIFKRGEKLREHGPVCCRQQQIDGQIVAPRGRIDRRGRFGLLRLRRRVRALVLRVALLNGVGRRVDEVFVRKHGVVVADAKQIAVGDFRAGIFEVEYLGKRRDGEEHHAAADDGRAGVLLAGAVILHRAGGQVTVEHALPLVEDGDGLFLVVRVADAEVVRPVHRRTGDIEQAILPERHRFVAQVAHTVVHGGEVQRRRGRGARRQQRAEHQHAEQQAQQPFSSRHLSHLP